MDFTAQTGNERVRDHQQATRGITPSLSVPSAGDELRVKWSGLLLAGFAFIWTRFPVIDAVYQVSSRSVSVIVLGLLPLILGLSLVAYGVSLAVSTYTRSYVRTVTIWYLLGTLGMVLLTSGSMVAAGNSLGAVYSNGVFAGAVIGGGLGGVLFGRSLARNRRQRSLLDRHQDQSVLLNRLLRHEVLNALTSIRGHANLLADGQGTERSQQAVERNSKRIEETIAEVGVLIKTNEERSAQIGSVSLPRVFEASRRAVPSAEITLQTEIPDISVRGDDHLATVLEELLRAACERSPDQSVTVSISTDRTSSQISISGQGEWLSEIERRTLEEELPEFDSPDIGYGLCMSRLLVALYGGHIEVSEISEGTVVEVVLPKTDADVTRSRNSPGVDSPELQRAATAGVVSGVAMGLVLQLLSGTMVVIGGLYDVPSLTVGWIAHLFHSVVFATLFAAVAYRFRPRNAGSWIRDIFLLSIGYSFLLWVVAGGVVMGVWLNALGIASPIPNLGLAGLIGHLVWGFSLGGSFVLLRTLGRLSIRIPWRG